MRKTFPLVAVLIGFSYLQTDNPVFSQTLYRSGPGLYGGSSYQDSNGNFYNEPPKSKYGDGLYGGGMIQDKNGRNYNCNRYGQCFDAGFSW